jgi:hypothetical protein
MTSHASVAKRLSLAVLLGTTLVVTALPSAGAVSTAVPAPIVRSPKSGLLEAVSLASSTDGWAVGYSGPGYTKPLAEQWNGQSWQPVPIASRGSYPVLSSVSALGPDDAWAAGLYGNRIQKALIEHWDGSQWSQLHADNPGNALNELNGVSADSASDAWAAGASRNDGSPTKTLVEHDDGSAWKRVTTPNPGDAQTESIFYSIDAMTPSDVWAVGSFTPSGESEMPLAEHWNGSAWSIVSVPAPEGSAVTTLSGVDGSAPDDVWAVGSAEVVGSSESTVIEHWDGSQWTIVPSPDGPKDSDSAFTGVSVISANDAWASGSTVQGGKTSPLLAHWDGSAWTVVHIQTVKGKGRMPVALSFARTTDGWLVGGYLGKRGLVPLFEHWDGTAWQVW